MLDIMLFFKVKPFNANNIDDYVTENMLVLSQSILLCVSIDMSRRIFETTVQKSNNHENKLAFGIISLLQYRNSMFTS